jgi:hypothetical protein
MILKGFLCIIIAVVYLIWTSVGITELIETKGIRRIIPVIGIIIVAVSMVLFILMAIHYFNKSILGAI